MSFRDIISASGSGASAQNIRLNTIASNLANADSVSGSASETYKARNPVFAAALQDARDSFAMPTPGQPLGVRVLGIVEDKAPLQPEHAPHHPLADENGFIYRSNVNPINEMANMIDASRSFQINIDMIDMVKNLHQKSLTMGQ